MLGMRKATKKASVMGPAPNALATTMSRTNPRRRLSRVALAIPPSARTTCPSLALILKFLGPCGMMQRGLDIDSNDEELSFGEHEVGNEADATERAQAPAQPGDALEAPRCDQGGPRRRGRLATRRRQRGDPRARQGRHQGCGPPQHGGAQEVRARPASRRREVAARSASPR